MICASEASNCEFEPPSLSLRNSLLFSSELFIHIFPHFLFPVPALAKAHCFDTHLAFPVWTRKQNSPGILFGGQ